MKLIPKVKANQIYCTGCDKAKFAGLFTAAQKRNTPGEIRCMQCQGKRVVKNPDRAKVWRRTMGEMFPGNHGAR
jgi:hypothetical protein